MSKNISLLRQKSICRMNVEAFHLIQHIHNKTAFLLGKIHWCFFCRILYLIFFYLMPPPLWGRQHNIRLFFCNLFHVTYLIDDINSVGKLVWELFGIEKIFLNVSARRILIEKFPNLPLSPKWVITCWDMRLCEVLFYANNYDGIKTEIDDLTDLNCSIRHKTSLKK